MRFRFNKITFKEQWAPNIDIIKGIINDYHTVRKNTGLIYFKHVCAHQDEKSKELDNCAVF
jgi:hypothetical protein